MPVFIPLRPDPPELVVQGEQLHNDNSSQTRNAGDRLPAYQGALLNAAVAMSLPVVAGEVLFVPMMADGPTPANKPTPVSEFLPRANAVVATTAGQLIPHTRTGIQIPALSPATDVFTLTGTTVTGAGVALGGCRVVIYETGRIAVDGSPIQPLVAQGLVGTPVGMSWKSQSPVVAEAVSDGSGNFTITVPMNVAYQLTSYLTGSPDRAGITKNTVVPPGPVLIYTRDPTIPDPSGGGGSIFIVNE